MKRLVLPLKAEFFNAIKAGTKVEEFRLRNEYWTRRLGRAPFDQLVLTLGYPAADDGARRIVMPWRGMRETVILHSLFGPKPVAVFAIRVAA